ncbi:mannose-1-phosphate guanylyltransferase/mannose-6-phosphate isomerase [Aliiroseovarius sp.]|uniref:mannose-1-phosphate guanylyltransferase/mannose-6-phosphate isomerase n=1 Tax=Aliiroseovarius sp. TaxID=1872442 RepID=UPI002611C66A|nr:mannose-1-phosphate guanylyltransferase/mannose-6-phosphate isomerase [Aliiroseovarius sp.]
MIFPVILCGGSGTRLWPLSRKSYPKQFVPLAGDRTLFQASTLRLSGAADFFAPPVVVTSADFRFIVTEQLTEIGIDPGAILIEPEARNTAPAVLAAALHIQAQDPEGVMLVAPSDHAIPDGEAFRAAVEQGLEAVRRRRLVTFGVTPSRPETGYGYLELSASPDSSGTAVDLKRFVEKPDQAKAEQMIAADTYLWNSGIFLFRAADIISAFKKLAPGLMAPVSAAVEQAEPDLGFLRLAPGPWSAAEVISIDYAIMERADKLSVVPFCGDWSDLGGWDAIWRDGDQDADGVVTSGETIAIDCQDTLLRSDNSRLELVGIGLENMMVVAMNDAVLVADRTRAQDVKKAVCALKAKGAPQAVRRTTDFRPWGWFESLAMGKRFQVKRIHVHPGAALSLQSHVHRAEHWIVVEGTARVTVDNEVKLLSENESVYVRLGAVHRLENPGKVPMVLIEVQTGTYLGEDDITRYEDLYARNREVSGWAGMAASGA